MKWTVKLVAETAPGAVTEHDLLTLERPDRLTLAQLGLSVEETKALLAALQNQLVPAQIERHGQCCPTCRRCGRPFRGRGSYPVTFHSLFGDVPVRVRRLRSCPCQGASRQSFSTAFTNKHPVAPELSFLTAKLAALMPFGKAAAFLAELLPLSTGANAATVRNRTRRVGQRLEQQAQQEDQALRSAPPASAPAKERVLGLDGAYVRSRHRRPEKNFEVIVGKVLGEGGTATRFAFPTNHLNGATLIRRALRRQGAGEQTRLTVFSDGEEGLRELQRKVAPEATHILDWFHVAMRFEHLLNLAQGQPPPEPSVPVDMRAWSLDLIRRAKWALWHGQTWKTQAYLEDLCGWCHARRPETPQALVQLGKVAQDLWAYLETNRDSLPNYGARYRADLPISTAFAESAVNEIVAKRMNKNQQMRWNRYTVQPFLTVRVHVLNGTLEEAFRAIHRSFRPPKCPPVPA